MLKIKCMCVYTCMYVLGVFAGEQEGGERAVEVVGDCGDGWVVLEKLGGDVVRDKTRKLKKNERVGNV